jgi:hypothetical protein
MLPAMFPYISEHAGVFWVLGPQYPTNLATFSRKLEKIPSQKAPAVPNETVFLAVF